MNSRRPEMADIVRMHHRDLLARWNHVLSRQQRKALRDIGNCRSAALGGRVQQCDSGKPSNESKAGGRNTIGNGRTAVWVT